MTLARLYAIVDYDVAKANGLTVPGMARACLEAGARMLQVRAKGMASGELLRACEEVASEAARFGATLIVNDRADIARLVEGAGVHVGQDDLPASAAREILGPDRIVGLSTHTAEQVDAALAQPVSYIAVGPVFGTRTKDTGYTAVGLELVRYAAARVGQGFPVHRSAVREGGSPADQLPIVAIGGITLETARSVFDAGASSVAVISDLFTGGDLASRIRAYSKI